MRVLHLVWSFSPLTETFVYDPVSALAARVPSMVVAHHRENEVRRPFDRVLAVEARPPGKLQRLVDRVVAAGSVTPTPDGVWVRLRRGLAAAASEFQPDVIHAHFGEMGVLAAPVGRSLGVPVLTSFYGYDASLRLREPVWPTWFRALTRGRNRVIVLAEAMRRPLEQAGLDAARIDVVPTGKRLAEYPFRLHQEAPSHFITVGRLVEKKGHLDAVEAVARLVREGHQIELEVIGGGPLAAVLAARVEALGLRERVALSGALDHATTRSRMEGSDALLLCSRTASDGDCEGLPTVLLEAQALGLPCVSTTHSGIPEAVPPENHWLLAPEGDVDGIVAVLRRLCRATPAQVAEVSRRGRAHVEARHDVERQADLLLGLYRRAVEG